jgi:hydroxymethylpyrimidine/phosphomethylpyrimidine kinase
MFDAIIIFGTMIHSSLTIAGSDPSGGAGIQADLKTFTSLNVYGMSVVAALTAQNTRGVYDVMPVTADFVGAQLDAIMTDVVPDAVKTGMLAVGSLVEVVAQRLRKYGVTKLVVDPVLVSSSGTHLLDHPGEAALKRTLLPLALLVTPNLTEAGALTGMDVVDTASPRGACIAWEHVTFS